MPDFIRLEQDGAVGVVTMAKPTHNLLDAAFLEALCEAFERGVSEGYRALLLRSDMRHFCAGADVGGFSNGDGETDANAGKRNLCIDLNWPEARELVGGLCRDADVICENFRPGTLARFGLSYPEVAAENPGVVYVSMSGYGQAGPWRGRPAFAPTVQAEAGLTELVHNHFGEALREPLNDACSHADVYTGLQGAIAVLAGLHQRERTGRGQHIDVAMAATLLSVNERAGALLSGIDTDGEPLALSAPDSPIFELPDGRQLTIAASPVATPIFGRYCAMMRRNDLRSDPRFASPALRRKHLDIFLEEVRGWVLTFRDLEQLQAQVSEAGLAIGVVRSTEELAETDWAAEWGAIVEVDDRSGGTLRMPGPPWRFSGAILPPPGPPAFQGEHNSEVLAELGVDENDVARLESAGLLTTHRPRSQSRGPETKP